MSDPGRTISEEELHAWIDGQLEPERRSAVQRYLQEQPDVAHRVTAWRDQREALRAAFSSVAAEPIPPRLGLERLLQERLAQRRLPWRAAASVLLAFALGGAGGWFLHGGQPPAAAAITLMAQQAVANHVVYTADRRRPTELGAQQRDQAPRYLDQHVVAAPVVLVDGGNLEIEAFGHIAQFEAVNTFDGDQPLDFV